MLTLPEGIRGSADPRFTAPVRAFARLFARYVRTGGALSVRLRGEPVVRIWTGTADAAGEVPWQEDTSALTFSTTKGITSLVVHRLADRGLLDYDTPVAEYWPEFAAGGKHSITVRDLLAHRAGLSDLRRVLEQPGDVLDHVLMEQRMAAATPDWTRGLPVYHAVTFGWLLGGLCRAVTGQSMAELYRTELAEPLGITGLSLGRPADDARVAELVGPSLDLTGTRLGKPITAAAVRVPIVGKIISSMHFTDGERALSGPIPELSYSENGAATGVFTADAIASVYSVLADDGCRGDTRLLSPGTTRALIRSTNTSPDPNRLTFWHLGYHPFPTVGAPRALGHMGLGGSGGWADPDSGLSVGFVHNRLDLVRLPLDMTLMSLLLPSVVRAASTAQRGEKATRAA
ncbi:beta-lactamase family protein [Nocardia sp. NBC_01503]|uniref:serine hydrolase domain-containing protein n=1 Tax=Nocardia sp. NBC_01503 TaxID=2975997 RepID=UPI002E7B8937|nr:serine hydrolase domain-containing protein [Nocardia sp. NBC_01503]WTL33525.1 beta-lactamase family protein [Nocardia sp. NBC_01503]